MVVIVVVVVVIMLIMAMMMMMMKMMKYILLPLWGTTCTFNLSIIAHCLETCWAILFKPHDQDLLKFRCVTILPLTSK